MPSSLRDIPWAGQIFGPYFLPALKSLATQTAGGVRDQISGLFTASQVGTVELSAGRDIVLSGVAAAVVGGVSLFGGRGRLAQAAVGALLISMITNGLGLLGLSAGITLAITGAVLALAATVDALSRRRSGSTSLARS